MGHCIPNNARRSHISTYSLTTILPLGRNYFIYEKGFENVDVYREEHRRAKGHHTPCGKQHVVCGGTMQHERGHHEFSGASRLKLATVKTMCKRSLPSDLHQRCLCTQQQWRLEVCQRGGVRSKNSQGSPLWLRRGAKKICQGRSIAFFCEDQI